MTASGDYYEMLGVPRDASTKTIKDAFRQLARRYHPDISTEPDAEQRFKEIAEAYSVLSDPARRASYDAQGSAGLVGATAEDLWGSIDFTDIFGSGAAAFGGLFERLFGPAAAGSPRGEDVHLNLDISMYEVLTGGNHAITIRRPGPCPQCAGSGARPGTAPCRCPGCGGSGQQAVASRHGPLLVRQVTTCPRCQGHGRVIDQPCATCAASGIAVREETVTIRIPPGIPEGAALRLAGHGMPSPVPGGLPGDAYVSIRTRADPPAHPGRCRSAAQPAHPGTRRRARPHHGRARSPGAGADPGASKNPAWERATGRRPGPAALWRARPRQPEPHRGPGHPAAAQPAAAPALRAAPGRGGQAEEHGG